MKNSPAPLNISLRKYGFGFVSMLAAVVSLLLFQISSADDRPGRAPVALSGMYKVTSSSDPLFPVGSRSEWFLDFGDGLQGGANSGKVAVSMRENPKVSVRIMVWQYFPNEKTLMIGNQYSEGSGNAVAKGVWGIGNASSEVLLARGNCTIVLSRANPMDY